MLPWSHAERPGREVRMAERSEILRRLRDRAPAALAVAAVGLGAGTLLVAGGAAPDRHVGTDHLIPAQAYAAAAATVPGASPAAVAAEAAPAAAGATARAARPAAEAEPGAPDDDPERIRGPPAA